MVFMNFVEIMDVVVECGTWGVLVLVIKRAYPESYRGHCHT